MSIAIPHETKHTMSTFICFKG